ncbi:MAG: peptidase S10, partial [Rhodanobacter sp.]
MRKLPLAAALAVLLLSSAVFASSDNKDDKAKPEPQLDAALLQPQSSSSEGSVSVEGHRIDYKAVAGTLILHGSGDKEDEPQVSMFYVAYFKKGVQPGKRPVTFIYNGGPGSAT